MSNRLTFELVDKTIRFLCDDNDRPFGGKVVIIGGDFKQCLPIVQDGNRAAVIQACIKSSRLWNLFQHYRLQTNMRVRPEEQDFIRWLERLGNNTLPTLNERNTITDTTSRRTIHRCRNYSIRRSTFQQTSVYSTSRFYDESNFESAIHNEKTSIPGSTFLLFDD
ncbi:PIF1-like helicase [Popillia japonica]|uniref:ATP-dependent DNA helicase n=1 Tax=Popillia japonica TaxID=7064 RepID=A0AAW1HT54_POPJA